MFAPIRSALRTSDFQPSGSLTLNMKPCPYTNTLSGFDLEPLTGPSACANPGTTRTSATAIKTRSKVLIQRLGHDFPTRAISESHCSEPSYAKMTRAGAVTCSAVAAGDRLECVRRDTDITAHPRVHVALECHYAGRDRDVLDGRRLLVRHASVV